MIWEKVDQQLLARLITQCIKEMKNALYIKWNELPTVIRSIVDSVETDETNLEEFVSYYESLACMIDEHYKAEKNHRRVMNSKEAKIGSLSQQITAMTLQIDSMREWIDKLTSTEDDDQFKGKYL